MLHISFSGRWASTQHGSNLLHRCSTVSPVCPCGRSLNVMEVLECCVQRIADHRAYQHFDFYSSFRMNANDVSLRLEQHCARTEGHSFFKSLRFPSDRGFTESRWRSINSGSAWTANVVTPQLNKRRRLSSVTEGKQIITHLLMGWDIHRGIKQATKVSSPPDSIPPHPIAFITLFFLHHCPCLCLLCLLRIGLPQQDCSPPPGLGDQTAGPWTPAGLACLTPSVHAVFRWVNHSGLPGHRDSCWSDLAWCWWLHTLWRCSREITFRVW